MDKLSRGTALAGALRAFCVNTTDLVQEAVNRHDLYPTAAAALGRTLSVASIMGSMLKDNHEKIEITIDGNGPLGQIVADGYHNGNVRGYVDNPHVNMERADHHLDVGRAVGTNGVLRVVKDMGMKQPFVSEVPLQTGEIGQDFAYYYAESEQTPSVVSVGVLVDTDGSIKASGALVIQMLPQATDAEITIVENIAAHLKPLSTIISEMSDPTEILKAIFSDYEESEVRHPKFRCECARGKIARVISRLPKEDLEKMISEDDGCEVVCRFCAEKYHFQGETLRLFLESRENKEKDPEVGE